MVLSYPDFEFGPHLGFLLPDMVHQMHFCIEGTFTAQKHVGVGYQSTMRTSGMLVVFSLALRLLALRRLRFLVRE